MTRKLLFNSIDQLTKEVDKIDTLVKQKTVNQICLSAKKIIEEADKFYKAGDDEMAYIYYGRLMKLVCDLQKKNDYEKYKSYIRTLLGGNNEMKKRMDRMEDIHDRLLSMYNSLKEKEKEPVVPVMEIAPDPASQVSQKSDKIDCKTLYDMMEKESSKILVIDCRSAEDFEESRIAFKFCFNVPENLCSLGYTASHVQRSLPEGSKVFWEMRRDRPIIIFLDWFSESFVRNSAAWHLRNILTEWDQDVEHSPELLILKGGYDRWLTTYPMKSSNPHVKVPKLDSNLVPAVDGIEYPNLEDIEMKDTPNSSYTVPSVDRSTKLNAMKVYENNWTNLSETQLLEEKDKLLNKSLQNEKELIKLETDYESIVSNKENLVDDGKEQQYLYKILELNTKQKDVEAEKRKVEEVLENKKPEMTKMQDLEIHLKRMKEKELEFKHLHEERERKEHLRQKMLKEARQNQKPTEDHKAPLKAPRKSELILSPKTLNQSVIPHFDRSSKPSHTTNTQSFYDNQDFAPVYQKVERGLTGLKNLGNTCYMNSIIQCLSHTLSLTRFLLENDYEKQINRTNNTKGHIVRTLAAVIKMLWSGECKYISSKHLKAVIGEQDHLFYGMEQQDSHEFLVMLIDWLQSDLQSISMQRNIDYLPASEKAWLEYTKAKESFILRLFYGQIKSTVKCTMCHEESATFETFSNLSLGLPHVNLDRCHIMECFNSYFNGERISGWNCPKCKEPRDVIKKVDISKLPPVLIIHLKRFSAEAFSSFRKKTVLVDFPLTNLSMISYVAPSARIDSSNTNHNYNLYAVSNHYGSMESGHYTAFCRNFKQKKWYKFDDHHVTAIDSSDVKSSAAYILFYTYFPDSNFSIS